MAYFKLSQNLLPPVALASLALFGIIDMTSASPLHHRDLTTGNIEDKDRSSTEKPSPLGDFNSYVECPSGHYFSDVDLACKACSACPVNQIIRKPCSAGQDTLCGPFLEFDKFHQTPVKGNSKHHSKNGHHGTGHHHHHKHHQEPQEVTEPDLTSVSLSKARSQWRTLSIALIVVLSVVCALVIIAGLYVCLTCRRARIAQKQYFREPALLQTVYPDLDPEPRYVQTYFTSRDRIRTSRHLPVYQQIYTGNDVSEFPPLPSTAWMTKTTMSEGTNMDDQYIYFNYPAVSASES